MMPFHAFHLPTPQYQPPVEPLIWIVNPSKPRHRRKNPWSPKNPLWASHDSHGPHVALLGVYNYFTYTPESLVVWYIVINGDGRNTILLELVNL
ncbi:hypothetical protein BDR04DRAFT_1108151 [Suillus decipiens]|nr:hypothetical protein BDR04DRAFT_1108151 [Suillus decipiens]